MKKYIILVVLFVMPICAYLFFATGVNHFSRLPIITKGVTELPPQKTLDGKTLQLKDKITILAFPGETLFEDRGNAFNLNQKIYNRYKDFEDFQVVFVGLKGTEGGAEKVIEELEPISDLKNWNYLFLEKEDVEALFNSLQVVGNLNAQYSTPNVYIVDKDRNLRGRKGANKDGVDEYMESYNTVSAAELHNDMMDDVKVLLAEYRLALKKYNRIK